MLVAHEPRLMSGRKGEREKRKSRKSAETGNNDDKNSKKIKRCAMEDDSNVVITGNAEEIASDDEIHFAELE